MAKAKKKQHQHMAVAKKQREKHQRHRKKIINSVMAKAKASSGGISMRKISSKRKHGVKIAA